MGYGDFTNFYFGRNFLNIFQKIYFGTKCNIVVVENELALRIRLQDSERDAASEHIVDRRVISTYDAFPCRFVYAVVVGKELIPLGVDLNRKWSGISFDFVKHGCFFKSSKPPEIIKFEGVAL